MDERLLDLIDAGVAADRMVGGQVSAVWGTGDRHWAAIYGRLTKALIAYPPDWGLSLFLAEDAWLWISAEDFECGRLLDGPDGRVLSIGAGAVSVTVEPPP
jgi:hypothetical protein